MMRQTLVRGVNALALSCLFLLSAIVSSCGTTVHEQEPQQTVVISPGFQALLSPVPTAPPYRCGAWSANNVPGAYSTLTIYAKLTHDGVGVTGASAKAIVHFMSGDLTLDQKPLSDTNGYVMFTLPLLGRQPRLEPATITVSFELQGESAECSAFFTPQ